MSEVKYNDPESPRSECSDSTESSYRSSSSELSDSEGKETPEWRREYETRRQEMFTPDLSKEYPSFVLRVTSSYAPALGMTKSPSAPITPRRQRVLTDRLEAANNESLARSTSNESAASWGGRAVPRDTGIPEKTSSSWDHDIAVHRASKANEAQGAFLNTQRTLDWAQKNKGGLGR